VKKLTEIFVCPKNKCGHQNKRHGFICLRRKGHKGPHHALFNWTDIEGKPYKLREDG
jgi:hypothetical protein